MGRTPHLTGMSQALIIDGTGREIGSENGQGGPRQQPLAELFHAEAGAAPAAEAILIGQAVAGENLDGSAVSITGELQQFKVHCHGGRDAGQHRAANPVGEKRRHCQTDQRPHTVADQRTSINPEAVEQGRQPVGHVFDGGKRFALAAAMSRQIHSQGLKAAAHVKAAVQCPDGVIHAGAVDKKGRARCRRLAAAGDEGRLPENLEVQIEPSGPVAAQATNGCQPLADVGDQIVDVLKAD